MLFASSGGAAQQAKQVHETLDSALATERPEERAQIVDLRKNEALSSIPWLNQKLMGFEVTPRLQTLLYQADLKWTAGSLIAACALCFVIPGYLVFWRFGSILIALGVGLLIGFAPLGWVFHKRARRLHKFQEGLPEALDMMVSALRAGHSLIAATPRTSVLDTALPAARGLHRSLILTPASRRAFRSSTGLFPGSWDPAAEPGASTCSCGTRISSTSRGRQAGCGTNTFTSPWMQP